MSMCTAMINQARPCDNCLYPCTSGTYEESYLLCMCSKVKLLIYIVKPLFYFVNETAQYDKTDRLGRSLCIQGADGGFQVSWNWLISVSQLFHLPKVEMIFKKWWNEMNATKTHMQKKCNAMQTLSFSLDVGPCCGSRALFFYKSTILPIRIDQFTFRFTVTCDFICANSSPL